MNLIIGIVGFILFMTIIFKLEGRHMGKIWDAHEGDTLWNDDEYRAHVYDSYISPFDKIIGGIFILIIGGLVIGELFS